MTTQFPNDLDTLKKDWANDTPVRDDHPEQHNNVAGAIEALQTKVGINGSAVETSFDYKLSDITGGDKAISTSDLSDIETDISNLETADTQNVKITGGQSIAGVKTFSNSPIVPDPTTATQATNKQWVENYVEDTGKDSVGLFTSGSFITELTSNLKFENATEITETAVTGVPTIGTTNENINSEDGVNVYTATLEVNIPTIRHYTYDSGTKTISSLLASDTLSADDFQSVFVQPISDTLFAFFGIRDEGVNYEITAWYGIRSGTSFSFSSPEYGINANGHKITDVYQISPTSWKVLTTNSSNDFITQVFTYNGVSMVAGATTSASSVVANFLESQPQFLSENIVVLSQRDGGGSNIDRIEIWDLSGTPSLEDSITTSEIVDELGYGDEGNTLSVVKIEGLNRFLVRFSNQIVMEYDGVINILRAGGNNDFLINNLKFYSDTGYIVSTNNNKEYHIPATGGIASRVVDLDANGHIGYMLSSGVSTIANRDFVILNSTLNNGDYETYSTDVAEGPDSVIVSISEPIFPEVTTETATIALDFTDAQGFSWRLKGTNFYLGVN